MFVVYKYIYKQLKDDKNININIRNTTAIQSSDQKKNETVTAFDRKK